MFRNSKESRREKDGIVYFVRPDIEADGKTYERLAVQTHFVERGEDYIELIKKYVLPLYEEGDVLSIGEKIMSMCQNNTVEKKGRQAGLLGKISFQICHALIPRHRHGRAI